MRADSIHMTLLFLGETPEHRLDELKQAADMVHGLRFDLVIDRIEAWRHNAIVYAGMMKTPEVLAALAKTLRSQVAAAGFKFDARAFAPHITLMRKVERLPESELIDDPMQWSVNEFVLVQSVPGESGMRYDIIGRWPLESV